MSPSKVCWKSQQSIGLRSDIFLAIALVAALLAPRVEAFSLLGPYQDWMTPTVGLRQPDDIGGPMNLGEEYRWNVPVLTYSFDQNFLDYFGSEGTAAVESAMSVLNSLPAASTVDPNSYPQEVTGINYAAQAQGLVDLKSQALSVMLEQLGLTSPTRSTVCLRSFTITNGIIQGLSLQRNFDPITLAPTNQVNDTIYSHSLSYYLSGQSTNAAVNVFPVDPTAPVLTAVADGMLAPGAFFKGLTRDDVGGLRYLLHTNNFNLEPLLSGVHGIGTNAVSFVDQALRPGIDKLTFVRVDFDALNGHLFSPYTNQFTDTYISNGTVMRQQLERVITQPDIIFSSSSLLTSNSPMPRVVRTGTTNWIASPTPGQSGPGLIKPQVQIVFSQRASGHLWSTDTLSAGVTVQYFQEYQWGSFDLSTNSPSSYPVGSILGSTNHLTVRLSLHIANLPSSAVFNWQLSVPFGAQATLQTSTNLTDWATVISLTNHGRPVDWDHTALQGQRYFRALPY